MAKVFSSIALTLQRYLRLYTQRNFSSEIKGSWNKTPICKGRKMPEPKVVCHPKGMSCGSNLGDCPKLNESQCGEARGYVPKYLSCCFNSRLQKDPCAKSPTKKKRKHVVEEPPFKSMWDVGFPKEDRCPAFVERLDERLYAPSDKEKRRYTKTWKACADVVRRSKICCFDEVCSLSPPFEKRRKTKRSDTASEQDSEKLKLDYNVLRKCMETIPKPNAKPPNKCRKIKLACCRPVAKTIVCKRYRVASKCMKYCCPYPSFSECDHPKLGKGPPVECRCRHFVNQCDINCYNIRRETYGIPPPLPAWPPKERPK